ncbi:MAG: hypothetical protein PHE18_01985 [Candidatus Omnitrophica bacterium]|nr:hypothetical protein [Candidatus Omnitrophota bacterium]MDD5552621.1 hypothetical protein [Candidatus Omnitrophota bacterium]
MRNKRVSMALYCAVTLFAVLLTIAAAAAATGIKEALEPFHPLVRPFKDNPVLPPQGMVLPVIDHKKKVTDPELLRELERQGIDKDYVELFQDYAPGGPGQRSKFARFYRDLRSGKHFMVTDGLPRVDDRGNKIEAGWKEVSPGRFRSKANVFLALVDANRVDLTVLDRTDLAKPGDRLIFSPQLLLDGKEVPVSGGAKLLPVDAVNANYKENVLEWDYGIARRRLRLIEGQMQGSWIFDGNPGAEVRIIYNQKGNYRLTLGKYAAGPDEERVPLSVFNSAVYPLEIGDIATFYTSASDGTLWGCGAYATARTAASATYNRTTQGILYIGSCCSYWGDCLTCGIERSFVFFDTSSLGAGATVTAATLSLYGAGQSINPFTDFYVRIQNGQPTYPNDPLQSSDYSYTYYSGDGGSSMLASALSPAGYHDITLNQLGWINKTGTTKLAIRSSRDIDGTGGNYSESVYVNTNEAGGSYQPKLVVTYTVPSSMNFEGVKMEGIKVN